MAIEKKDLKVGVKYKLEEVEHLLENKYKDRKEPDPVKSLSEVDDEIVKNYNSIAEKIKSVVNDCIVRATGSRVNRNYLLDSDYDVLVYANKIYWDEIRKIEFDVKVDFQFQHLYGVSI